MKKLRKWRLTRPQRLARDLLILLLVAAAYAYLVPRPHLDPQAAYRTLEERYLIGPSEILAELEGQDGYHYVIGQREDYLSYGQVYRQNGVWTGLRMEGVFLDPQQPLTTLAPDPIHFNIQALLLIHSSDPEIDRVECEYLVTWDQFGQPQRKDAEAAGPGLYLFDAAPPDSGKVFTKYYLHDDIRLLAYDAGGQLIYEDPVPDSWGAYTMAQLG